MFALDLFNTRYERDLREGAVDDLEGRRIDDLNAKMQDLLARAKNASPEMKAGLKREFDKVKAERDGYFKIKEELSGNELSQRMAQLGKDAENNLKQSINKQSDARIAALKNPPKEKSFMQQVGDKQIGMVKGAWKGLTGGVEEAGIPGNVPADKIPGKEDLLKGKGRSYYEAGIPGSIPTEKIPGKEDLLKGKGRSYYEAQDQKKNSKEVNEHGGGIGPRQHWQDLMQENKLSVGDPIVVTGPNEFEGKTGEIYEFSPSGSFVIVNLYNHGKHSMHLSDIEYNEYADQEQDEEDDWYDDEDTLEESNNPKLDQLIKMIQAGKITAAGLKDPAVRPRIMQMVQQADPQADIAQLVATYAPATQVKATNVNDLKAQARSGNVMAQLPKTSAGTPTYAQQHSTFEGFQDFNKVEPYAVCLAGKPVKKFDYYEEARRFHDNWKKKLYREGNKEKADKITLLPLGLDEEGKGTPVPAKDFVKGVLKDLKKVNVKEEGRVDPILIKALNNMPDGLADHHSILNAAYDAYTMEVGKIHIKQNYGVTHAYIPKLMQLYKDKYGLDIKETKLNPRDPAGDLAAKRQALQDLAMNKEVDQKDVQQRKLDLDKEAEAQGVVESGFGRDEEFLNRERNAGLEHETNNIQISINGKPWKVMPGKGYADSQEERSYLNHMRKWAEKKSAATGKKWTVSLTGANISEAETDYSKRRQRERDVDAGKPVAKQRQSKMTDYQKKRAQDKKDMALGEDQDTSGVERAILNRIMTAHTDLLMKFGPDKVMQAAEEVAYNVGNVDEIGTSDVSAYVDQVRQILGA